ncbi:MAG: TonB-dependent receptor plug domain-containing protein [Bacteroidia bacterium]|nr:TonB-dependent receptor plug domain-containing protein [Bacteroidia bacterium]
MRIKKHFLLLIIVLVCGLRAGAAVIKGHVYDSKSKEGLIGAIVYDKNNTTMNATTGLDGTYKIKHLGKGSYTFIAKVFGYLTIEKQVTIADSSQALNVDFSMDMETMTLGDVQILSNYEQNTDNYARGEEKNAPYIMNVVSSNAIQLSPDLTVADVLQRVSGIVEDRSATGQADFANIRGMDGNYNYTSIDGVVVPSPEYKTSAVPMDLFPSDIVERLEVYKSATPDMEGDFIGGAMNLVLKDAPPSFMLTANVATGYDGTFFNKPYTNFNAAASNPLSPQQLYGDNYRATTSDFPTSNMVLKNQTAPPDLNAGFAIGNRFFKNKLGVLAAVSYQNMYNSAYGMFICPQAQPYAPPPNLPIWNYISSNTYSEQQTRMAAHLKLDYEFNPRNTISLYTFFTQMYDQRAWQEQDTSNTLMTSELNPTYKTQAIYDHIFNTAINGKDSIGKHLLLDWKGSFATTGENMPDYDILSLTGQINRPASADYFSSLSRIWETTLDNSYSGYVNLSYFFKLFGQSVTLKAGGMDRYEDRTAFYTDYNWAVILPQPYYTNIGAEMGDTNNWKFQNPQGDPQSANGYKLEENITGYYGMASFSVGPKIDVVGGLRVESTYEAYQDNESNFNPGQSETKTYTDYLPSIDVKYKINKKNAVHADYFASISRPPFFDIIPYSIPGDYFEQVGNPLLEHTQANNYDLRYEFFPNPTDQLLAGVFYKQIYNPYEIAIVRDQGHPSVTNEQPVNVGGDTVPLTNYGFELQTIKFFRHFGILANYTYTHSDIVVPEQIYETTSGTSGFTTVPTTETRPLQGQAANIANLSLIYKEPKIGFQIQVAGVYTGKEISDVSGWYGLDLWQMPMFRLDLSFEKKLSRKLNLMLYGKANNLLNTPVILRIFPPSPYSNIPGTYEYLPNQGTSATTLNSILVRNEYFGQSFILGVRYKFQ